MAVTFSDTRMRDRIQLVFSLGIFALVALLPAIVRNEYWQGVLIVSMYFAMLAAAWNLLAGYTGQFSLAPAAFGMIGAYVTGLLSYHFNAPPLVGIPASVVVAAAIGFGAWPHRPSTARPLSCTDHAVVRRDLPPCDQQFNRDHARRPRP